MASNKFEQWFNMPNRKISRGGNRLKDTEQSDFKSVNKNLALDDRGRTKQIYGNNIRRFMEYLELQSAKRVADRWEVNSSNLTSFIKIDLLDVPSGEQAEDVNKRKLNSYARKMSLARLASYSPSSPGPGKNYLNNFIRLSN